MAKIIIEDLTDSLEMDRLAMTKISGGFNSQPEPPAYGYMKAKTRVQKNRFGLSCKRYRKSNTTPGASFNAKGIIIING